MIRRAIIGASTVVVVVAGLFVSASTADPGSEAFAADGTVVEVNSTLGPTSIQGESAAFKIGPPSFTPSPTAAVGVDGDGNLKVYVTPATTYYKDTGAGAYARSTYSSTIVQDALIRVHGRRVIDQAGEFRFIATTIWNGPPSGTGVGGGAPTCGAANGMSNHAFRFIAVVADRRVRVPCTNIGGQPGGFRIDPPEYVSPLIASNGVAAYGGSPDIYVTPLTTYYLDGAPSNFDTVVLSGLKVQVDGRYVNMLGAWLFAATRVDRWTVETPPPASTQFDLQEDLSVAHTGGTSWQGTSRAGNVFGAADISADLAWTQTLDGWSFSGTLEMLNSLTGDRITANVVGSVTGTSMTSTVTMISGAGRFNGGSGSGTLNGSAVVELASHPSAFDAHLSLLVSVPN